MKKRKKIQVYFNEKTIFIDRGSKFYEQLIDFNSLYKNLSPCIILILL